MRPVLIVLILVQSAAVAQQEGAAYTKVRQARDMAKRFRDDGSLKHFEDLAYQFVARFPRGERASDVYLWIGDLLKDVRPREAHEAYLKSRHSVARERAADIAFRFEAPPELAVERWVGKAHKKGGCPDSVHLLFFVSMTHPQTRKVMPYVLQMYRDFHPRGLMMTGVAAVVDDHRSQTPDALAARIQSMRLPFPMAIDKQRPGKKSISLVRYRGRAVPWTVVIDRYGRIAWFNQLNPAPNSIANLRRRVDELLHQPTFLQLEELVKEGNAGALRILSRIRTKDTTVCLTRMLKSDLPDATRSATLAVLRDLLPQGYLRDDPDHALRTWASARQRYRYSFADDRLVRK